MIPRYALPEMSRVWSDARRLALWLEVELAVTAEREARGELPQGTTARIRAKARIDEARMQAIEAEVHHDVIAFLSMLAESVGEDARHVHVGMTSSDLVDTALACQIHEAGRVLAEKVRRVRGAAWCLAERYRRTPMVGRTHGIHAITHRYPRAIDWCWASRFASRSLANAIRTTAESSTSGYISFSN